MKPISRIFLAALLAVAPFLSGCNDSGPSSKVFVKNGTGERFRVAVLPFDNVSRDQDAGRVVTNTVVTYLLSTGSFDVVEPGIVYAAMGSESVRLTDGITLEAAKKLQPRLNADAYIMGMVEEYGEVRIGPDTYPSISFSARLVDARTAEILWAATISKTGADKVKVFDIGRVSSLGKLSKTAVASLASSLQRSRKGFTVNLPLPMPTASTDPKGTNGGAPSATLVASAPAAPTVAVTAPAPEPVPATTQAPAQAPAPASGDKSQDEAATYGEAGMKALLKDIGAYHASDITYKKHFHDTIEARYNIGDQGKFIEVKVVDYLKPTTSEKFLRGYNPEAEATTFESMLAFTRDTEFGYHHLDLSVGRFGLFLRGPKDDRTEIEAVGKGMIALLK